MFGVELYQFFAHLRANLFAYLYSFDAIFADAYAVNHGHV